MDASSRCDIGMGRGGTCSLADRFFNPARRKVGRVFYFMNQIAPIQETAETRPGLIATLRTFPRPVWVLCGGSFLNKFGAFVIPFLALYMTRHGFSVAQAGVAIGAFGLGNFAASIVGGQLADTIGRRKTIVLSMASVAVSMLLLSQARSFTAIVLLTALTG